MRGPSLHAAPPRAATAAGKTADDDVEEGDDAVDDGGADGADGVDDGHQHVADCAEDTLNAGDDGAHGCGLGFVYVCVVCVVFCRRG